MIELEREYLAAAMLDPRVLEHHPLEPTCFGSSATAVIFEALTALHSDGRPTDPFAVVEQLRSNGRLGEAGGERKVIELAQDESPGVIDMESVASELRRSASKRKIVDMLGEALRHAQRGSLEEALGVAGDMAVIRTREAEIIDAHAAQLRAIDTLSRHGSGVRIYSGIGAFDRFIGHIDAGDLMIVGADTSVGKTTVALMMAHAMAKHGIRCGVVSCEDNVDKLGAKLLGFHMLCDPFELRRKGMDLDQRSRMLEAVERDERLPLHMAFPVGGTEVDVTENMARMVRQHGCQALFVDYVQTINPSVPGASRKEDIRRIASRLKGTAHRLNVPLVLASQVTRPPLDKRGKPRRPSRHDLKECGDLENMAEYIVILWKGSKLEDGVTVEDPNTVHAVLDKSKVGGDGLRWDMHRNRFGVLAEIDSSRSEAAE